MIARLRSGRYWLALVAVVAVAALMAVPVGAASQGFVRGIVIEVDGEDYYLAGPPVEPDGPLDVPGHYWVLAGRNRLVGKHYNTGPDGASQWWSSDAPDGELLFMVHGIVDDWTLEKAERYAERGYVHYHELVSVEDGELHPTHVVWLKHTARTSFTLDGGPMPDMEPVDVTPGIEYYFMVNWMVPYPNGHHD